MKKVVLGIVLAAVLPLMAQQLPDPHFEKWTDKFNKDVQPADWHGSNVNQVVKFTLLTQQPGRTGYCAYVANRRVGAMGITEVAPGYFSLGRPFQYMKGLNTKSATGGTEGGIAWKYRPDTMSVWIKRDGPKTSQEDFHLLYYAWTGTAKSSHYRGKGGSCTETERINEQSDIRKLDPNPCGSDQPGKQVAEGWFRQRGAYGEWTQIKVPIYYLNSTRPEMCNVIFAGGNYPAGADGSSLLEDNGLYVDDVELIYSSRIDKLVINGQECKEFNPNSEKEQTLKIAAGGDVKIEALRGVGVLANAKGEKLQFHGRKLDSSEMTVEAGAVNGKPWVITVKAEDGSSTHTYKLKLVH